MTLPAGTLLLLHTMIRSAGKHVGLEVAYNGGCPKERQCECACIRMTVQLGRLLAIPENAAIPSGLLQPVATGSIISIWCIPSLQHTS